MASAPNRSRWYVPSAGSKIRQDSSSAAAMVGLDARFTVDEFQMYIDGLIQIAAPRVGRQERPLGLERIRRQHPPLGRHLAITIRTGYFCVYQPNLDRPICWRR